MKSQMKAILASAVVIALCLATVGGVTYSWFSDYDETEIDVDIASLELKVDLGEVSTSGLVSAQTNETGHIVVSNLAAMANVVVPYTVSHKSTIQVVYSTIVEVTVTGLKAYDLKNIFVCNTPIDEMIENEDNGTYSLIIKNWTTVDASPGNYKKDFEGSITISTPATYGDINRTTGKYVLPDGSDYEGNDWSPSTTGKKISVKVTTELYQGDYPNTTWNNIGTATVPSNGTVSGDIVYEDPASSETEKVTMSIGFTESNNYRANNGEGEATSTTGTKVSSSIVSLTDSSASIELTLSDTSSNPVSSPRFDKPVLVTATFPGDLTTNGTPSVNCNGENMEVVSCYVSGSGSSAKTTITFQTSHFSEFLIIPGGMVVAFVDDFEGLMEAIKKKSVYIVLKDDITYSDIEAGSFVEIHDSNVILDLRGHKISNTNTGYTGIFDIYDSKVLIFDSSRNQTGQVEGKSYCFETIGTGSITILSGKYTAVNRIIDNHPNYSASDPYTSGSYTLIDVTYSGEAPTVTINGGEFTATGTYSSAIVMEAQSVTKYKVQSDGSLIKYSGKTTGPAGYLFINGGTFDSTEETIFSDYSKNIIITGGTFNSNDRAWNSHAVVVSTGNLTITGGTFNASEDVLSVGSTNANSTVKITGGTFNAKVTADHDCSVIRNYNIWQGSVNIKISGGNFVLTDGTDSLSGYKAVIIGFNTNEAWVPTITGGTFNKDPMSFTPNYIGSGCFVSESDGIWTVIHTDGSFNPSNGTYTISTVDDMLAFEFAVNKGTNNFADKTITLLNDIDLTDIEWTPIGQTYGTQFMGTFDGQNHTIKNLTINSTDVREYYSTGLFGWLNSAVVKDLKVNGADVTGHHYTGVIAGYLETSGCTIENCHVTNAKISCTSANSEANGDKAGVIVGHAGNGGVLVKDCTATNSTVSAGRDAGQVVGAALTVNIQNCSATNVTVTANDTSTGDDIRNEVIGRVL